MEDRLTELEIRLALQDDLLDELNRTVARQQQQMEWLLREMHRLQAQQLAPQGARPATMHDEVPPHY